ncbi:MAG: biotin--[acetyl-CoA-carboxylase] ligase [Gracilibacteraceae bacterium]|nr:biotin--[acetyl-CoA-carboxylase] ligase [Gracilibacteraceae bacterium]
MKLREKTLLALCAAAGNYISGEALAEKFGVSRGAIWKCVTRLKNDGHVIEAAPKKGYRLTAGVLSAQAVMAPLRGAAQKCRVFYYETVDSTNQLLKKMAEDGAPEGAVVVANAQTRGRGQRERGFFSPEGTGLYISVLLRQSLCFSQRRYLAASAAVAAAEAVREVCGLNIGLKWVNDLWLGDRKVGGILTEGSLEYESGHAAYAVLGFGLNVLPPAAGFPSELAGAASSLYHPGALPASDIRGRLAAEFLSGLFLHCGQLKEKKFLPAYRRLSCLPGRRVTCSGGGRVFTAKAVGIDDEARLVVRLDDGREEALTMGEVRVVPEKRHE